MFVKQLSIFMENKAGRMAEISRVLADGGVNIRALSVADTTGYGILRLIVADPFAADLRHKEPFLLMLRGSLFLNLFPVPFLDQLFQLFLLVPKHNNPSFHHSTQALRQDAHFISA